jgi:hypothetical protein
LDEEKKERFICVFFSSFSIIFTKFSIDVHKSYLSTMEDKSEEKTSPTTSPGKEERTSKSSPPKRTPSPRTDELLPGHHWSQALLVSPWCSEKEKKEGECDGLVD